MKKLFISLFLSILFLVVYSQKDSIKVSANEKPITIEIKNPEKKWFEYPIVSALSGALIGGLIGFLSSFLLARYNIKQAMIKDLKDARAELAALFDKITTTAHDLFQLNHEYNYFTREKEKYHAIQEKEYQRDEKIADSSFIKMREKKNIYDLYVADSTKYIQKFTYHLNSSELAQVRDLLLHIKRIDFARYDYINSKEEKAKNLNLENYWKLGQGEIIHSTIVKDEIIDKFLVPMQTILRGVVRKLDGKKD